MGAAALSVNNATTFLTLDSKHASIRLLAPIIFVLIYSVGLYSALVPVLELQHVLLFQSDQVLTLEYLYL